MLNSLSSIQKQGSQTSVSTGSAFTAKTNGAQPKNQMQASAEQRDVYFPSPDGIGEGPSLLEMVKQKLNKAWESVQEQPKFINPMIPSGKPLVPQQPSGITGSGKQTLPFNPAGTGEFLGNDLPDLSKFKHAFDSSHSSREVPQSGFLM